MRDMAGKRKNKPKRRGRFLVWTMTRKGNARDLGRFNKREVALAMAMSESIARESSVYVDEDRATGSEPIATYTSGMSMRI